MHVEKATSPYQKYYKTYKKTFSLLFKTVNNDKMFSYIKCLKPGWEFWCTLSRRNLR